MRKTIFSANPFYALLVIAGVAFVITALSFGMMSFLSIDPELSAANAAGHPYWRWMSDHGDTTMYIELTVLAIGTVGAITWDINKD